MKPLSEAIRGKLSAIRKELELIDGKVNVEEFFTERLSGDEISELEQAFEGKAFPEGETVIMKADLPISDSAREKLINKVGKQAEVNVKELFAADLGGGIFSEETGFTVGEVPEGEISIGGVANWTKDRECSACQTQRMALWRCTGDFAFFTIPCDHYDEIWISSGILNTYLVSCSRDYWEPYRTSRWNRDVPW